MIDEQGQGELLALHFNHAIHPESDSWQQHCEQVCRILDVPIICGRWLRDPGSKYDEGMARTARYEWFRRVLPRSHMLLLAHHLDDQVETCLMNFYEGRFLHRVAGMRPRRPLEFNGYREIVRPLLGVSRSALYSYVESRGMPWIDDPTNRDPRNLRARLRTKVIPRMLQDCPDMDEVVIRAAQCLQRVVQLQTDRVQRQLAQVIEIDALRIFCRCAPLSVCHLNQLDKTDQEAVLRQWIHMGDQDAPSGGAMSLLLKGLDDLSRTRIGLQRRRKLRLDWSHASIRAYRERLYLLGPLPAPIANIPWSGKKEELVPGLSVDWTMPSDDKLKWPALEGLVWRWRRGGERIRLPGRGHRTSLKKACQMWGIPDWERDGLPHLTRHGEVVWLHGIGWCDKTVEGKHRRDGQISSSGRPEPAIRLIWQPNRRDFP